jgi:hypothetical protein
VILLGALAAVIAVLEPETVEEAQRVICRWRWRSTWPPRQPPGPMFNSYNWGGYLMFALPEYPVYADGRTDLYRDEFLLRYLRTATGGEGWREVLDQDDINTVVIEARSGLARMLALDDDWTRIYPDDDSDDENAVIYVRRAELTGAGEHDDDQNE